MNYLIVNLFFIFYFSLFLVNGFGVVYVSFSNCYEVLCGIYTGLGSLRILVQPFGHSHLLNSGIVVVIRYLFFFISFLLLSLLFMKR